VHSDGNSAFLEEACAMFEEALTSFEMCCDVEGQMETFYLMSVVHHMLPAVSSERDYYANKFMDCYALFHQAGFVGVAEFKPSCSELFHRAVNCLQH
jgi:hypothetical protein